MAMVGRELGSDLGRVRVRVRVWRKKNGTALRGVSGED